MLPAMCQVNSLGENETPVVIQTVLLLLTLHRYIHGSLCCALVKARVNPSNMIDILDHRTTKYRTDIMCIYLHNKCKIFISLLLEG